MTDIKEKIDIVLDNNKFLGKSPKNYYELANYLNCNRITFYKMFNGAKCGYLQEKIENWLEGKEEIFERNESIYVSEERKLKKNNFVQYEDECWYSTINLDFESENLKFYWCVDKDKKISLVVRDYANKQQFKIDKLGFLVDLSKKNRKKEKKQSDDLEI